MSHEMQAIRFHEFGGPEKLKLETLPRPTPKAGEVLIQVQYAGVNPVDWKYRSGMLQQYMPVSLPYAPGIDVSGTIEEVGSGVTGWKKGQTVVALAQGGYAEFAIAAAGDVVLIPPGLALDAAATLPVGALTAWSAMEAAPIGAGQTVVVQGAAGGVGLFAVQLAKWKGARVIGVASAANLDYVRSLGADQVIDYAAGQGAQAISGADVVIDTVGGDTLERSYALLKKGGIVVTVSGRVNPEKAQSLGVRAANAGRAPAVHLAQIVELAAAKTLVPAVGTVFPLVQAAEAHRLSETRHGRGRILLKP